MDRRPHRRELLHQGGPPGDRCPELRRNYPTGVRHCTLQGSRRGLYFWYCGYLTIEDISIIGTPHCSMRFGISQPVITGLRGLGARTNT